MAHKFKEGDVVELTHRDYPYGKGDLLRITQKRDTDQVFTIDVERISDGRAAWVFTQNIKLHKKASKTWDTLAPGDVIHRHGIKHRVLDVLENCVLFESAVHTSGVGIARKADWKEEGWKIEGAEEEPRELTLKEIADKFNIPVDELRIKD